MSENTNVPETVTDAIEELESEGGFSKKKLVAAGVLVVALAGMAISAWYMRRTGSEMAQPIESDPIGTHDVEPVLAE